MKKSFVSFALIFILFSSGCTVPFLNIEIPFLPDIFSGMQVEEQRHDVVSIETMQAIPFSTLRSGQTTRLRAIIKNLQKPEYEPISDVVIGLYNDCGLFDVSVEFCQGEKSQGMDTETGMYQCKLTRMHPQSTSIVEWVLKAKSVNVETSCKVGILAKYYYKTYSTSSVTFINKIDLERLVSEGKSFSETGIAKIGEGPVKPYVEVLNQPIVIDFNKGPLEAGSGIMSFWIENKGLGLLDIASSRTEGGNLKFGCKQMEESKICLNMSSTEKRLRAINQSGKTVDKIIYIQDCIKGRLEKPKTSPGEPDEYSINFIGKSTPKYSCTITVAEPGMIKEEKTYQITAEVGYSYKFTKEIMVTVRPKIRL
jgi:hypothetical protein